jgi:hypothetical protein
VLDSGIGHWWSRFIYFFNFVVVFSSLYFRFRILIGDFCINRRCAPTVWCASPFFKLKRDLEIERETEMAREMHMKMVGDGDN